MEDWLVMLVVLFSSSSCVIIARCGEYKKTIYQEIYILFSVESVSIEYHIWSDTLFIRTVIQRHVNNHKILASGGLLASCRKIYEDFSSLTNYLRPFKSSEHLITYSLKIILRNSTI